MNGPYKWSNSTDEEDDQGSSWESELEGEITEELASLETPDAEGECCWPRRNRITGWRRRVVPRPAFHYFAEDDEEVQASGGLKHVVQRNAGGAQWTWKRVTVVVDSGSGERNAAEHASSNIHRGTGRSKKGKGFNGPGGEHTKNSRQ